MTLGSEGKLTLVCRALVWHQETLPLLVPP